MNPISLNNQTYKMQMNSNLPTVFSNLQICFQSLCVQRLKKKVAEIILPGEKNVRYHTEGKITFEL